MPQIGRCAASAVSTVLLGCLLSICAATGRLGLASPADTLPHHVRFHMPSHGRGPYRLAMPVSQQECKPEQLPAHLGSGADAAELSDYVLTTASGYSPYKMRTFLTTFRQHNQAARVLIFVNPAHWSRMRDAFCEYGSHYSAEFFTVEPSDFYPVNLLRFRAYKEVLDGLAAVARNILMVDVRDVLFQGDIFAANVLPPAKESVARPGVELPYVTFTQEGDAAYPAVLEDDEYDKAWILKTFNASVYEAMRKTTVVCAGTILGGQSAVRAYLQLMTEVVLFIAKEECMEHGVDQAIHNYMVYYLKQNRPDMLKFEALLLPNDESPFYSMGWIRKAARMDISETSFAVYNGRGARPPVLHQWDRHQELLDHIMATLSDTPW